MVQTGGGRLLIAVSIKQRFCGHSRQAGYITAQCQAAAYMNRFVIVVDDDVDPMNLEEVMWAVSTRCEPSEDIEIMRKSWGSRVDPLLATSRRLRSARSSTRVVRSRSWTPSPRGSRALPRCEMVAKWKDLFTRPSTVPALPETVIPTSAAVDDAPSE
jgi:hypothetical protein